MEDEDLDFVCVAKATQVPLCVQKSKSIWEIRSNGKRLWIKSNGSSVKYPYTLNPFKPDTNEGSLVINMDQNLSDAVEYIDCFVYKEFLRLYEGKILSNVHMTRSTLRSMFRESTSLGTLKLNVSPDNCAVFTKNESIWKDPDLTKILKAEMAVSIVAEPVFVWMRNGRIGIHWAARQLKIDGRFINKVVKSRSSNWKQLLESNPVPAPVSVVRKVEKPKKMSSFLFLDHSDEEKVPSVTGKKEKKKEETKVPRFSFLSRDKSDDDDEEVEEVKVENVVQREEPVLFNDRDKSFSSSKDVPVTKEEKKGSFLLHDDSEDEDIFSSRDSVKLKLKREKEQKEKEKKKTSSFSSRDGEKENVADKSVKKEEKDQRSKISNSVNKKGATFLTRDDSSSVEEKMRGTVKSKGSFLTLDSGDEEVFNKMTKSFSNVQISDTKKPKKSLLMRDEDEDM
jgi:hypothetical protein